MSYRTILYYLKEKYPLWPLWSLHDLWTQMIMSNFWPICCMGLMKPVVGHLCHIAAVPAIRQYCKRCDSLECTKCCGCSHLWCHNAFYPWLFGPWQTNHVRAPSFGEEIKPSVPYMGLTSIYTCHSWLRERRVLSHSCCTILARCGGYLPWKGWYGCPADKTLFFANLRRSTRPTFQHISVPQDPLFNHKSQNFRIFP